LGAAAGAALTTQANAERVRGANARIKVGVIGCGGRGLDHCKSWQGLPDIDVAFVCDPDKNRTETAAATVEKAGGARPREVADLRKALEDKSIDAVIVATCNHWHAPAAIMACAAGKHVYVEKPCSHNPWEGEMMVAAARKHDRKVQMGNQRRSSASITEAIEFVRGGGIGKCT
jgi:predicted dehydrogenase